MAGRIRVEVAYAGPEGQWLLPLELDEGATALDAVLRSGIGARIAGFDPAAARLGIFSRPATAVTVLRAGDRVEIYRPLTADPKSARRARAGRLRR